MIEILRQRRNQQELGKLHPAFRSRFEAVLRKMEAVGRPRLQDSWRDMAEQRRKFEAGLSQISGVGAHTSSLIIDGKSRPASLAVHVLDDDAPLAPSVEWVALLALVAARIGLRTGCAWSQTSTSDLAPGKPRRTALEAAIKSLNLTFIEDLLTPDPKRWGFDPLHVELPRWREFYGRLTDWT